MQITKYQDLNISPFKKGRKVEKNLENVLLNFHNLGFCAGGKKTPAN